MTDYASSAEGCRSKAEELRMMAENMTAIDCKELLFRLAKDYDGMAETLDKLAAQTVDLPFNL